MTDKNTDNLIDSLADDLKPSPPLSSPVKRSFTWLLASLLCIGAGISLIGLRSDLAAFVMDPIFMLETVATLIIAAVAVIGAFVLSIPGSNQGPLVRWLVGAPIAIWLIQISGRWIFSEEVAPHYFFWKGYVCSTEILALGILPGVMLYLMIRQAAPVKLGWTGALAAVAVTAMSAFAVQFTCSLNDPLHLLAWHVMPIFAIGAAGVWIGQKLLRW